VSHRKYLWSARTAGVLTFWTICATLDIRDHVEMRPLIGQSHDVMQDKFINRPAINFRRRERKRECWLFFFLRQRVVNK
jgi:hypothetical protein